MKLFDKLLGKSEKITVQFIEYSTGKVIGISYMLPEQLPGTFAIETKITISGAEWLVKDARPVSSADFIKTKSLILKLSKIEKLNSANFIYSAPTISNEFPPMSDTSLFNDFQVSINDDDWRQYEFLNKSTFPLIDIEVKKIKDIIVNNSQHLSEDMMGFTKCHARNVIGEPNLNLSFPELKEMLNISSIGSVKIAGNNSFVLNAIALATDNTTFYGILNLDKKTVTQLCISSFSDTTIDEIEKITRKFGLIFINWYRCEIITDND